MMERETITASHQHAMRGRVTPEELLQRVKVVEHARPLTFGLWVLSEPSLGSVAVDSSRPE